MNDQLHKGRGAQHNPDNPYLSQSFERMHLEAIDEAVGPLPETEIRKEYPKTVINKVDSPDIGLDYSLNPYQGCEHGCIYCYARNSHQYWGYSAGVDFESRIVAKMNVAEVLEKHFRNPSWEVKPIMLAGNTDVYQPVERQLGLTRQVLDVMVSYRHPVGIITKNSLILRDLDLIQELQKHNLVQVAISVTSLNEEVRRAMEPRTSTTQKRLQTIRTLAGAGIPVRAMLAPIIPGLTDHELPGLIKAVSEAGATTASYMVVRLNGALGPLFADWINKAFPERASKVLKQIGELHGGQLNDSRYGTRMKGEGAYADMINKLFHQSRKKYLLGGAMPSWNLKSFRRNGGSQLSLGL